MDTAQDSQDTWQRVRQQLDELSREQKERLTPRARIQIPLLPTYAFLERTWESNHELEQLPDQPVHSMVDGTLDEGVILVFRSITREGFRIERIGKRDDDMVAPYGQVFGTQVYGKVRPPFTATLERRLAFVAKGEGSIHVRPGKPTLFIPPKYPGEKKVWTSDEFRQYKNHYKIVTDEALSRTVHKVYAEVERTYGELGQIVTLSMTERPLT